MSSSVSDRSCRGKKKKMRKKSFVCDRRDRLVVEEETGSRLKELLTHVAEDLMLPKDSPGDLPSDERVAGEEKADECTTGKEKKQRDRNNHPGKKVLQLKKHLILGVNEILRSISSSSATAAAVLLTDPLETHVQRQLIELAQQNTVPCLCVRDLDQTLKSLRVPSMIGIALRPHAAHPSSTLFPLYNCIKAAAGQSIDVPLHPSQTQSHVKKVKADIKFQEISGKDLYVTESLIPGLSHEKTCDPENEGNVMTVAKDNFFPHRRETVTSSSPFVVSHQATACDRDGAFLTRFSFTGSNVDQSTGPSDAAASSSSLTGDEGVAQEKGVRVYPVFRPSDSVTVQSSSGKKRIRRKNAAKTQLLQQQQ